MRLLHSAIDFLLKRATLHSHLQGEQVHGLLKTRDFKNRLFVTTEALEEHVIQSFINLAARPNMIANLFKNKEVGFYSA